MTMTTAEFRPTVALTRPTLVWERACAVADLELSWGEAALIRENQIAPVSYTHLRAHET